MLPDTNQCVILKSRADGKIQTENLEIADVALASPSAGQMLLKNIYLSIDPGVRNLLGAQDGYLPPIAIGAPMTGSVLGKVVESRHPDFDKDDIVVGRGVLGEYSVVEPGPLCWKVEPGVSELSHALGVMGNTGRTAYIGLINVGKPKSGETVLVTGAAGGVGSLVGQIARLVGARAVGIAGGDLKCSRLIDEFGFDTAIDYKNCSKDQLSAAISEACPNGVQVLFDNVGGSILDAALPCMSSGGHIVLCGMISQYDGGPPPVMQNLFSIIQNSLSIDGFLLTEYTEFFDEADRALSRWINAGEVVFREEIYEGIDNVIPSFLRLFSGENQGKSMVKL